MPKKVSIGAQRRTAARVKATDVANAAKASARAAVRARARGSKNKSIDPELSAVPVEFDPAAYKFVLTPPPQKQVVHEKPAYEDLGELPEAYGTRKLFLVARDPHWLYAYWDLTHEQFNQASHSAHDGKVFLEVFRDGSSDRVAQVQVPYGVRNWYLPSGQPDATYRARLGYYRHDGGFEILSQSGAAYAPRDNFSWRTQARWATIPFHISFRELFEIIRGHLREGEELAEGIARLQEEGFEFPYAVSRSAAVAGNGNAAEALLSQLDRDYVRKIRLGSEEITEIIRRRLQQMVSSGQWMSSEWVSSPMGASFGKERGRSFFMNVNAELIIYGGTDPLAKVRVNGQPIQLRPDGTFSYHFSFPDGQFFIPIEATSPDEVETRSAMLSFARFTDTMGQVDATPQEPRPEPLGRLD